MIGQGGTHVAGKAAVHRAGGRAGASVTLAARRHRAAGDRAAPRLGAPSGSGGQRPSRGGHRTDGGYQPGNRRHCLAIAAGSARRARSCGSPAAFRRHVVPAKRHRDPVEGRRLSERRFASRGRSGVLPHHAGSTGKRGRPLACDASRCRVGRKRGLDCSHRGRRRCRLRRGMRRRSRYASVWHSCASVRRWPERH